MTTALAPRHMPAEVDVADDDLTSDDKRRLEEQYLKRRKQRIPKPSLSYILALEDAGRTDMSESHSDLENLRKTRYRQTTTPAKVALTLDQETPGQKGSRPRIFSGLTNSELNRVTAMLTRNMPEIWIAAKEDDQQKFFTTLITELENATVDGWFSPSLDSSLECGRFWWETYVREEIDDLDLERYPDEDPKEYRKRVAPLFRDAGRCIDVRVLDDLAVLGRMRNGKLKYACIAEDKRREVIDHEFKGVELKKYFSSREVEHQPDDPDEGDPGVPSFWGGGLNSTTGTAKTIRYYDDRWYAYICDGRFVEEPVEHGFPQIPITMGAGVVTSSSQMSQRYQGALPGIHHLEDSIDTQLTADNDATLTYGRAKFYWDKQFLPPGYMGLEEEDDAPVNLSNPMTILDPPRGAKLVNAYAGIDLNRTAPMEGRLRAYWQHATLNDVASGESPGPDVAGYTVNALQTASLTAYTPFLRGFCRALVEWLTMMRTYYKSLGVPISLAKTEVKKGQQPWMTIKPEQWDDTPIKVTMTPLSDQQKSAIAAELAQLVHDGVISSYTASRANPMVSDPDEEKLRIDMDRVHDDLAAKVYQQELIELGLVPDPAMLQQQAAMGDPNAAAQLASAGNEGATMPPPGAPSVGAQLNGASQQPVPESTQRAGSTAGGGGGPHALAGGEARP